MSEESKAMWRSMDSAPTDGTEFVALERWKDSGATYARIYRWEGPPNYWSAKRDGVCIRPEYRRRYVWAPLPSDEEMAEVSQ